MRWLPTTTARAAWALCAAGLLALPLSGCRLERVDSVQGDHAPEQATTTSNAEPLAWSRDVAVIMALDPPHQHGVLQPAVQQLARDLCERLTLEGNVDAAWHAALMQLERALVARGYAAQEALLSSSDGRWGASAILPEVGETGTTRATDVLFSAWLCWERGAGLQLLPEPSPLASTAVPTVSNQPLPTDITGASDAQKPAAGPELEDPSRNWVSLPLSAEQPLPQVSSSPGATSATEPHANGTVLADEDAGVAASDPETQTPTQARLQDARVALLVRLSDGSFRGSWLHATTDPATHADALLRDVVVGERLFVGALGAVVALQPIGQEPSAASRAYERLLQPGTGRAPATVVLTASTLEADERPGLVALSSRGALAGKCRVLEQESGL